jgi:hypothetical protein
MTIFETAVALGHALDRLFHSFSFRLPEVFSSLLFPFLSLLSLRLWSIITHCNDFLARNFYTAVIFGRL